MIQLSCPSAHAPQSLREQFLEAIESWVWLSGDIPDTAIRQLAGQLWNCTDTLPGEYCNDLEIPPGSTYAQAARHLRRRLR